MNPLGSFSSESLLEQGKSMAKKTGDTAMQGMKVTAQTAAAQLTGNFGMMTDVAASIAHGDVTPAQPPHDDQFVRELYGAEHNQQTQPNQTTTQIPSPQPASQPSNEMPLEEQHQLAATRQKLQTLLKQQHMESYFNPTFNRAQRQSEESVTEKNEREEQEKKFEDFEKQKKKPDFALQRAKTRTEMSPGASG